MIVLAKNEYAEILLFSDPMVQVEVQIILFIYETAEMLNINFSTPACLGSSTQKLLCIL